MENSPVEILFKWLDQTTEMVQHHLNEPYLDSLAFVLDCLFYQDAPEDRDDLLQQKIGNALKKIKFDTYNKQDIRKSLQLAILKGMKDSTQQQHFITPDTAALLVGYLAEKVTKARETIRVFDPACGTANMLTAVIGQLKKPTEAFGSEIDPTLLKIALRSADLQEIHIEFFHQDSLRPFLLDPIDLIVADLPVGYYPDDVRASNFELRADTGDSYAHHLFIEQSMHYVKDAGYLIFIIPDFLFTSDQSDKLQAYFRENAHIVGVLRLPESAFRSEKQVKSILVLQKKGLHTNGPKQPLLAQLPSFKNARAMENILSQIDEWFRTYETEQQTKEI